MDTLGIRAVMRFDQITAVTGIPEAELELFNPMYRLKILPGEPEVWPLRLPQDQILSVLSLQDSILAHEPEKTPDIVFVPEPVVYKVKSGDVLGSIANRYGVTVNQLREWNDIRGTMIRAGQKLYIHADPSKL
jgi:membrane-bound lytic murein transglycosylase D